MHSRSSSDQAASSANGSEFQPRPFVEESDQGALSTAEDDRSNHDNSGFSARKEFSFGKISVFPKSAALQSKQASAASNQNSHDFNNQEFDELPGQPLAIATSFVQPQIQRSANPSELQNSKEWYAEYYVWVWSALLDKCDSIKLDNPPYTYWLWGRNDSFVYSTLHGLSKASWNELVAAASPDDFEAAIRRGRDADADGKASKEYDPAVIQAVANELRTLFVPRIAESLNRLAPQFVAASYSAALKRMAEPTYLSRDYPQMVLSPSAITPARPLDKFLIQNGLCSSSGSQLDVNYEAYIRDGKATNVQQQLNPIRSQPVRFFWEAKNGTWLWIRVTSPRDASVEEVANELYGDPAKASFLVNAAPLFGFQPEHLTQTHRASWENAAREAATTSATPDTGSNDIWSRVKQVAAIAYINAGAPLMDPAAEMMQHPSSDTAALNQAKTASPTGAPADKIIERMQLNMQLLDDIATHATLVGGSLHSGELIKTKLSERIKQLTVSTHPTDTMQWDAHSHAQNTILKAVSNGVKVAAEQYKKFNSSTDSSGKKELPAYVQKPLLNVVAAYTSAADVSELVDTAQQRLAYAEEKSKVYEIEVIEGILAYAREILKPREGGDSKKAAELGIGGFRDEQESLRERLYRAKEQILQDPAKVQPIIASLQEQVLDLQDKAWIVSLMGTMHDMWDFMRTNQGFLGEFTRKNKRYSQAMDRLEKWQYGDDGLYSLYLTYTDDYSLLGEDYRTKQMTAARAKLQTLRAKAPELQKMLQDIAELIDDKETLEKWLTFGLKIAAVIGIGLVTAGVGSWVSGGLMTGAGWGMTTAGVVGATLVASGAEAVTFTALSNLILGSDPQRGIVSSIMENWLLFGALKGLAIGYEATVAANLSSKWAQVVVGKGGNIALGLTAAMGYELARADADARQKTGKGLTQTQAEHMLLEQLAVFVGTIIAARYAGGHKFLEGAYARGEQSPFFERFATIDSTRLDALKLAKQLNAKSTPEQIQDALNRDSQALQSEVKLLDEMQRFIKENPTKAKLLGLDAVKLGEMQSINQAQLEARKRTAIALDLQSEGGNVFTCAPGKLKSVLDRHRALGDVVIETIDPATGTVKSATVTTKDGESIRLMERSSELALDPNRFKLTKMFESLSPEAQEVFDYRLKELGPERAFKKFEGMQKSKEGLEALLLKEGEMIKAKRPPDVKLAEAEQQLKDSGFFDSPLVKAALDKENRSDLRGMIAGRLARVEAAGKYSKSEGYQVLSDVEVVEQFGNYKTRAEAEAANPDKILPLYELDGKVWRRLTDIDVLVLQKESGNTKAAIAQMQEVKANSSISHNKAKAQQKIALDALSKIAQGDTSIRIHQNRKIDITDQIDAATATPDKAKTRGLEGKPGFELSIGLTDKELNMLIDRLLGSKDKTQ
jgi:hypothetical protein